MTTNVTSFNVSFDTLMDTLVSSDGLIDQSVMKELETLYQNTPIPIEDYDYLSQVFNHQQPRGKLVLICTHQPHTKISRHLINNSIGTSGSEEILLNFSDELARLGYRVEIISTIDNNTWDSLPHCNPRFRLASELEFLCQTYDVKPSAVIAFRETNFNKLKYLFGCKVIYWPMDWPSKIDPNNLDSIMCLSSNVLKEYEKMSLDLKTLVANYESSGQSESYQDYCAPILTERTISMRSKSVNRDPMKCIFASGHHRGLSALMKIWPRVVEKYPRATLDVYFGRGTFINYDWPGWSKEEQTKTYEAIESLPSVREFDRVSHEKLELAMSEAGFLLLPSNFPETLCITVIKAGCLGCIPLVSSAVSREVVYPEIDIVEINSIEETYFDVLDKYMSKGQDLLDELRTKASEYVTEKYNLRDNTKAIAENYIE